MAVDSTAAAFAMVEDERESVLLLLLFVIIMWSVGSRATIPDWVLNELEFRLCLLCAALVGIYFK